MIKNKHLGIVIDPELHQKLHYVCKYEGRSANAQILYLVRQCVAEFEAQNGKIEININANDDEKFTQKP